MKMTGVVLIKIVESEVRPAPKPGQGLSLSVINFKVTIVEMNRWDKRIDWLYHTTYIEWVKRQFVPFWEFLAS